LATGANLARMTCKYTGPRWVRARFACLTQPADTRTVSSLTGFAGEAARNAGPILAGLTGAANPRTDFVQTRLTLRGITRNTSTVLAGLAICACGDADAILAGLARGALRDADAVVAGLAWPACALADPALTGFTVGLVALIHTGAIGTALARSHTGIHTGPSRIGAGVAALTPTAGGTTRAPTAGLTGTALPPTGPIGAGATAGTDVPTAPAVGGAGQQIHTPLLLGTEGLTGRTLTGTGPTSQDLAFGAGAHTDFTAGKAGRTAHGGDTGGLPILAGTAPTGTVAGTALVIVADGRTGGAGTRAAGGILGAAPPDGQQGTHAPHGGGDGCLEDGAPGHRSGQLLGQLIKVAIFHASCLLLESHDRHRSPPEHPKPGASAARYPS
jgi:hypothetical protein